MKGFGKWLGRLVVVALLAGFAHAVVFSGQCMAAEPYKIGAVFSITGAPRSSENLKRRRRR